MCDCISSVNQDLAQHNSMLVCTLFGKPNRVIISTCKVEEKKRGKLPSMLASFCPFCGEDYAAKPTVALVCMGFEEEL